MLNIQLLLSYLQIIKFKISYEIIQSFLSFIWQISTKKFKIKRIHQLVFISINKPQIWHMLKTKFIVLNNYYLGLAERTEFLLGFGLERANLILRHFCNHLHFHLEDYTPKVCSLM